MEDAAGYIAEGLPALLDVLQGSDVRELEVRDRNVRVRVHRVPLGDGQAAPADSHDAQVEPPVLQVVSPAVGTFYRAAQPGAPPFVEEGSPIEPATVVGIVEALHVLTDIEAQCSGVVTRVLATDGQPVEYGQVLLEVEPRG